MIGLSLREELEQRGISRRDFLGFCASMASILGFRYATAAIAEAVEKEPRPILVWLEFQDCAGNTESFLRASHPTVADLILDTISLNYHETLMAAAGSQAEGALSKQSAKTGKYIALVEGSIPTGADGAYCTIGGRSALDIAREVCGGAAATIAVGTCAAFGGIPAAAAEPDRRTIGRRCRARRAKPDQHVGLPGQRREHHRAHRLLPDLEALAATRPVSTSAVRLWHEHP